MTDPPRAVDPDPAPARSDARQARLEARVARLEPYLALVALLSLVCIMLLVSEQDPGWAGPALVACWLVLAVEYLTRLVLADDRWSFARHSWVDLLAVLIPFLRIFLFARIVPILGGRARRRLANRAALAAACLAILVVSVGSVAMLWVEEGRPDASIETMGESLWWAFVTVFTVGYGDYTPVTTPGRAIGVVFMFVGVAVIAVFTASIATRFLSDRDGQGVPGRVIEEEATLEAVLARLDSLESRLVAGGLIPGPPTDDSPTDETRRSE